MSEQVRISNYDPQKKLQYTIYVCEKGNVTGFEVVFDEPQSLVDFRPERVFAPVYGTPQMRQPTIAPQSAAHPSPPCRNCGGAAK